MAHLANLVTWMALAFGAGFACASLYQDLRDLPAARRRLRRYRERLAELKDRNID